MSYAISFAGEAESDIDYLHRSDKKLFQRILNKIESLQNIPLAGKPLVGNHAGEYSLRVGNYRIIYEPDHTERIICILTIKHRKRVY